MNKQITHDVAVMVAVGSAVVIICIAVLLAVMFLPTWLLFLAIGVVFFGALFVAAITDDRRR